MPYSEDVFWRQRRNVIVISVGLIIYSTCGGSFGEQAGFNPFVITLEHSERIEIFLWLAFSYFIWRYSMHSYMEERTRKKEIYELIDGDKSLLESYQMFAKKLFKKCFPDDDRNLEGVKPSVAHGFFSFTFDFKSGLSGGTSNSIAVNPVYVPIWKLYFWKFLPLYILSSVKTAITLSGFSNYTLPLLLATLALISKLIILYNCI